MKLTLPLLAGLATAVATRSHLVWMSDSFLRRGVRRDFHYTQAVLYLGFEAVYELSKNETVDRFYKRQIDSIVAADGTVNEWDHAYYSLDDYRMANNYLYWYERTKETRYRSAADTVRAQLNRHPRTPSGGFWHRQPVYPNQMWLDGIFMADTFYAQWTSRFDAGNTTAWDDIVRQWDLIETHTRNTSSGLLAHGYDESKRAVWANATTGAAPLVWSRAVGWYFLSLLEVLQVFPTEHAGYARLCDYFVRLAAALVPAQHEDGGFWLIMSEPYVGMEGNYIESSATALFTATWLKAIRLGLLSANDYLEPATRAYQLLLRDFVVPRPDGTLDWEGTVSVGSLSSSGTYEVRHPGRIPVMVLEPFGWES